MKSIQSFHGHLCGTEDLYPAEVHNIVFGLHAIGEIAPGCLGLDCLVTVPPEVVGLLWRSQIVISLTRLISPQLQHIGTSCRFMAC